MDNNCTISRVHDSGRHTPYTHSDARWSFPEEEAKRIAWTLAHDYPSLEFQVLEHGEFLESFLVGDDEWVPVGVVEFPDSWVL